MVGNDNNRPEKIAYKLVNISVYFYDFLFCLLAFGRIVVVYIVNTVKMNKG